MPWRFVCCIRCGDVRTSIARGPTCSRPLTPMSKRENGGKNPPKCYARMKDATTVQCISCKEWIDLSQDDPFGGLPPCPMCAGSIGYPRVRTMRRIETPWERTGQR